MSGLRRRVERLAPPNRGVLGLSVLRLPGDTEALISERIDRALSERNVTADEVHIVVGAWMGKEIVKWHD